jgi:DNA helicase-4
MTEFEDSFPHSTRLELNTTFRCPKEICDVSSAFIQANSAQITKKVKTTNTLTKTPILAYGFSLKESICDYVEEQLAAIYGYAKEGKLSPTKGSNISIMILGRYRDDEPTGLNGWKERFRSHLKINFYTVHGSKGLEADYVFVLNVTQGTRGFPSQIQDDPALQLAMPTPDVFPYAEERRLFYVAMTRALKQVRFYTLLGQPSQFLVELVKNGYIKIESIDGDPFQACPKCENGVLQERSSRYGIFLSCNRFPTCDFKKRATENEGAEPLVKRRMTSQRIQKPVKAGDQCPNCLQGVLQVKNGKNGVFLGCSRYREGCKATANISR